jgi:hypothetical protein
MFEYGKNHDPKQNNRLLEELNGKSLNLEEAIKETEQLFNQPHEAIVPPLNDLAHTQLPLKDKCIERLWRLLSKPSSVLERTRALVDSEGKVIPDWMEKLNIEYNNLMNSITREVNVVDFGAIGDGITDCTEAINKAIGNGRVKVIIPEGVYITRGIRLPSYTYLVGAGKGITTIRLHDEAKKEAWLVTNANHWKGNHHLFVEAMSLDWNVERLGNLGKTGTWNNRSSCLTFANVTYGWVKEVEAYNPGLHCFDISSTLYNYGGDGFRARGSSKYIWLDRLSGYGFGDDGITTHHSDYLFISNCHMCDPSGRAHQKGFSNSNGIEVDDGSRNVLLSHNSTARCFGGVEIKAHHNSSAASNVQIVGHISVNDNRSYNFRHIGHHKITDPESKTAYNILATNIAAITPVYTDLYEGSTPRGMVISAYRNVVINHFTIIGDPEYDFKKNPIFTIQYLARNVVLNDISFKCFHNAGPGIKVFGGDNRAKHVRIVNVCQDGSLQKTVDVPQDNVDGN